MSQSGSTYYDRPVLKEPVWIWAVPAYFFVGGASGAAATIGALAQALGRGRLEGLVAKCRQITAAGTTIGGALLVYDLGRPERFLNMLRVFRPTSAMSVGSWMLAAEGGLSTLALAAGKRAPRVADAAAFGSGIVGIPFSGYTAVLLADTSVPIWKEAGKSLPFLFVASSLGSAAAMLQAMDLDETEERVISKLDVISSLGELVAAQAVSKDVDRARVGRPLKEGVSGALWNLSTATSVGGLAVTVSPLGERTKKFLTPALGILGALALRFSIFLAGKASARDPQATFGSQRAGS